MKSYIVIEDSATDKQQSIINDYWRLEGRYFITPEKAIAKRYKLSLTGLQTMIEKLSTFYYTLGCCIDCGDSEKWESLKHQIDIAKRQDNSFFLCEQCFNNQVVLHQQFKKSFAA